MRCSVALLATFVFVGCSMTPVTRGQSQAAGPAQKLVSEVQKASTESPVEFLINSAAGDFHAQRQPHPARFRHVRVGHVMNPDGTKQYRLCGEFLPAQEKGKAEWTPFVTIKTSGYEQYLGAQVAARYCQRPTIIWDKEEDLSSSLQRRFDSMR
jgi:hypothetical protein